MCIAILKRKNGTITDDALRESFRCNADGAGIAYTKDKKLIIIKGIFNAEVFVQKVREIEAICDNNMLIHCRIGTSGLKDASNTHPFVVNEDVALIHNGILDVKVPKGSPKNDTQLFIESYLNGIDKHTLMHNKAVHGLIEKCIGHNNKFVLLDNNGFYKIINEDAGHWKDNVWYSNYSYVKPSYSKTRTVYPYGSFYGYYDDDLYDDDYEYGRSYIYPKQQKLQLPTLDKKVEQVEEIEETLEYDTDITEDEVYDLLSEEICCLSNNELKEMGDMPVLYKKYLWLISPDEIDEAEDIEQYVLLSEFSTTLYDLYLECKQAAELIELNEENEVA